MPTDVKQKMTKVEVPHDDLNTEYAHHEWVDVWLPGRGPRVVLLDSLGRRNGGATRWLRWCCNDPDCSGVLLVNADAVERIVNEAADD